MFQFWQHYQNDLFYEKLDCTQQLVKPSLSFTVPPTSAIDRKFHQEKRVQ